METPPLEELIGKRGKVSLETRFEKIKNDWELPETMLDCVLENSGSISKAVLCKKQLLIAIQFQVTLGAPKKVNEFLREIVIVAKKGKAIRRFEIHTLIYFAFVVL